MMEQVLLIHYGELGLKGENRRFFVDKLKKSIADKLAVSSRNIQVSDQRLLVSLPYQSGGEARLLTQLSQVFGIAWFAWAGKINADQVLLEKTVTKLANKIKKKDTFAVRVKRADKRYPLSSIKVEQKIGQILLDKTGATVNLTQPDKTLFIEIAAGMMYLFWERQQGLGGLPVGTSGKVLTLFSGGIDSPVAAWLMAKRGARVDLLHFCVFPPERIPKTKIVTLHRQLQLYLGQTRLYVVPYVHFQLAVSGLTPMYSRYEVLLFRRFMVQVAEQLAHKIEVQAIVTGDNLSQVASQTLENLAVVDRNRLLPVFRPLLGYDKQEIIALAKKIGTYETSIQPYKDCCSLLQRKPVTKGRWSVVEKAEAELDLAQLVNQSLKEMVILEQV